MTDTDVRPPVTGAAGPETALAPFQSESICQACGGPNIVWFAPNEVWNRVMPDEGGILCPVCFVRAAEAKGITEVWSVAPSNATLEARLRDAEPALAELARFARTAPGRLPQRVQDALATADTAAAARRAGAREP